MVAKAYSPISVTPLGTVILEKLFPANALAPIFLTLDGISMEVSPAIQFLLSLQPNALSGISVSPLGRSIFSRAGFVANAPLPSDVKVSGRTTVLIPLPWNAVSPMLLRTGEKATSLSPESRNAFLPTFSRSIGSVTESNFSSAVANSPVAESVSAISVTLSSSEL